MKYILTSPIEKKFLKFESKWKQWTFFWSLQSVRHCAPCCSLCFSLPSWHLGMNAPLLVSLAIPAQALSLSSLCFFNLISFFLFLLLFLPYVYTSPTYPFLLMALDGTSPWRLSLGISWTAGLPIRISHVGSQEPQVIVLFRNTMVFPSKSVSLILPYIW